MLASGKIWTYVLIRKMGSEQLNDRRRSIVMPHFAFALAKGRTYNRDIMRTRSDVGDDRVTYR